jgi:hypothetical protein
MHKKQLYFDTPICLFLIEGAKINNFLTLKLIIRGLLRLYIRDVFFLHNKNQGFAYGVNK